MCSWSFPIDFSIDFSIDSSIDFPIEDFMFREGSNIEWKWLTCVYSSSGETSFCNQVSLFYSFSYSDNHSLAIMSVGGIGNQEKEADSAIHEACQKVKNWVSRTQIYVWILGSDRDWIKSESNFHWIQASNLQVTTR